MIETILYNFLSEKVSTPVYTEIPTNPPSSFYLIEKTGGSQKNNIKRTTVTIQSYGTSLYNAASLNEVLKETILDGLIMLDSIVSVNLSADYNFTDTTTKHYRYQAVFEIVHY